MLSNSAKLLLASALALLLAPTAYAQNAPSAESEQRYVTQKGFGNRVFEVKHREPANLAQVLRTLGSGFVGAAVTSNNEFRTITVRDFPENISAMEEALRRLDTPEVPRRGIEFQVHLLVATNDAGVANNIPVELNDTVNRLRSTLGYKNFSLLGAQMVRSRDGRGETFNKGVAELRLAGDPQPARSPVHYNYHIRTVSLGGGAGPTLVQVEEFSVEIRLPTTVAPDNRHFETVAFRHPVSLREGERVVVGTTSVGDKSVVVLLSANATRH
jgi:hypothetical protein